MYARIKTIAKINNTNAIKHQNISFNIAKNTFLMVFFATSIVGVLTSTLFPAIRFDVYSISFTVYVIVPTT